MLAFAGARTVLERRSIAAQGQARAAAGTAVVRVDRARLMRDLRTLADRTLQGRRTGTEGGRRARQFIADAFETAGVRSFEGRYIHPFSFVHKSFKGLMLPGRSYKTTYADAANIVGLIPGRRVDGRWLVVSAHYDHLGVRDGVVYPGADDNASGVAVLLAVARILARTPGKHPVVCVAFDAEELGLQGAEHFVTSHRLTAARVAVDVNLDMVSRLDRREIFAAGPNQHPWERPLLEAVQRRSAVTILVGHDRPMRAAGLVEDWTHSSDHGPFVDAGIPFLYFGVEDHADYHRPTDTVDRIDAGVFGDTADMIVDAVLTLDRALQ
jgi:hypothetical protein